MSISRRGKRKLSRKLILKLAPHPLSGKVDKWDFKDDPFACSARLRHSDIPLTLLVKYFTLSSILIWPKFLFF